MNHDQHDPERFDESTGPMPTSGRVNYCGHDDCSCSTPRPTTDPASIAIAASNGTALSNAIDTAFSGLDKANDLTKRELTSLRHMAQTIHYERQRLRTIGTDTDARGIVAAAHWRIIELIQARDQAACAACGGEYVTEAGQCKCDICGEVKA